MNRSPSRVYLILIRRLHFLALLALNVPCYCLIITHGLGGPEADAARAHLLPLYLFTFALAIPASYQYFLQERVKNLGSFLLCALPVSFLCLAGLCYLEMGLGISIMGGEQIPQALILLLYLFDAIRMRTNDNSRKKAKAQEDHSWGGDVYLLPLPALPFEIPFAAVYICALVVHSNALAKTALVGAILYFFLVLPYHVLSRREAYLESRHHISRIPVRGIARLQGAALARVLIFCALIAAAALMTSGGRQFLDLPKLGLNYRKIDPYGGFYEVSRLLRLLISLGIIKRGAPPPQWLVSLFAFIENVLTIVMTAVLAYAVWLILRSLYLRFRKFGEKEEEAASLGESQDEHVSLKKKRSAAGPFSGLRENPIRRRYRRTILRSRRTPPDPCETPAVMEERAGLSGTPQMQELHESYERVRYFDNS